VLAARLATLSAAAAAADLAKQQVRAPLCVPPTSCLCCLAAPQICLPESVPWWAAFSVKTEQLVAVVRTLHELYQKPKAAYVNVSQEGLQPSRKVRECTSMLVHPHVQP